MKARELRIGNKFMNNGLIDTVTGVDRAGFVHFRTTNPYHDRRIHQSLIEGVPLTEEWLIKLGFNKPSAPPVYEIVTTGMDKIFRVHKVADGTFLLGNYESLSSPIKYVHHLQNLYFALTGEELTVKETV